MLYLAIDGGGTKTTCVLADAASIVATATAAGSNVIRVGEAAARASIQAAVQQVCAAAGVDPAEINVAVIGVAGAAVPQVAETIRRILADIISGHISVVGDMVIALEAAFASQPGVIVIAGTGSIAFGRNSAGQTARAGGWGYAISDEGSAHWIGRSAVAAALRACDAGQTPRLHAAVLETWKLQTVQDLVPAANAVPPPDFAQLFPAVLQAARDGDAVADAIFHSAGEELARLGAVVIGRLWPPKQPVRVALAGGVFLHSAAVRHAFYTSLRLQYPRAAVSFKVVDPVIGALWLARNSVAVSRYRLG